MYRQYQGLEITIFFGYLFYPSAAGCECMDHSHCYRGSREAVVELGRLAREDAL